MKRSGYLRILWFVAVLFPFGAAGVYAQDVQSFGVGTERAHELAPADTALITKFNEASLNLIRDGLYDKAITTAESAVEISRATENPKGEALGYYYLALSWYHKGNFSESLKNHKKSLDLSRELGDKYRTGKSHYAIGQVLRRQGLYPEALRNFLEAVEIQRELGSREDLAQAYLGIAGLYGSYDEHAKGLKYYGTAKEIMEEIGNYRSMADCLVCMGRSLDAMGESEEALRKFTEALALQEKLNNFLGASYARTSMGIAYRNMGEYDKALREHRLAVELRKNAGDVADGIAYARNNIGYVYEAQGNFEAALEEFSASHELYQSVGHETGIAWAKYCIGKMHLKLGRASEAHEILLEALEIAKKTETEVVIRNALGELAKADSVLGDPWSALAYHKMYIAHRDSIFNKTNTGKMLLSELQHEFDVKAAEARAEQEKHLATVKLRSGLLSMSLLVCALILFALLYITRLKKKKERQIMAADERISKLEKERLAMELEQAKRDVHEFIRRIEEKNRLVHRFSSQLKKLKNGHGDRGKVLGGAVAELRASRILTDEDWKVFRRGFNKIYPDFAMDVKSQHPGITPSQMRYLMMTKIGFTHKEMAVALGISTDAVRVTWNRVKKSLGGRMDDKPLDLLNRLEQREAELTLKQA